METGQPANLYDQCPESRYAQPWIYAAWLDGLFILLPPFAALTCILLFPQVFSQYQREIPTVWWVFLILLVDVSHVYATIYRTYLDPRAWKEQRTLLLLVPLLAWAGGVVLYTIGSDLFWRMLAYLAVFHFVRQQYGFLRIYSRKEQQTRLGRLIDTLTIYLATIYPIICWHFTGPRNFNWFVDGDFIYLRGQGIVMAAGILYALVVLAYMLKEGMCAVKERSINIPKQLLVAGTALSWYFGIVYFNGDLAFTLLNVVSHGIPYMALVWIYGRKRYYPGPAPQKHLLRNVFSNYGIVLFIGIVALLAYIEEGLWDGLVWREHGSVFTWFSSLPVMTDTSLMSMLVPLLALPQLTHYILDGFIWKRKATGF